MAKMNGTWKIITTVAMLLVIGGGFVVNYTLQGAAVASTSTRIDELDEEGCDVANAVDRRVLILEMKWDAVLDGQQEILKAVKEK